MTSARDRTIGGLRRLLPVALAVAGNGALAQEDGRLHVIAGIDLVSNYVANGVTQSNDNPAIQPYLELAYRGFYAGTWMSTVDFGTYDNWEIDLYVGYRKLFDNDLFVNLGYTRYLYDDTGDCCGEVKLTLAYPLAPQFAVTGYVAYNPSADAFNRRVTLAYQVNDDFGLAGMYGYSDGTGHDYWRVGTTYSIDDNWSLGLHYEGSENGDGGLVLRLSLGNLETPIARLLGTTAQR